MAPSKENGLSEYELQRQANIRRNQELFKELQLNAASAGIAPKSASKPAAQKSQKKKKPPPKVKEEDLGPRRTSARIKGIVADSEVAKRKAEEEHVAIREAERAKRQRRADDLNLGDIGVAGQGWDLSSSWLKSARGANPYERTFDEEDIKQTTNKELKELREKMSGLELYSEFEVNRIKITPERVYCMAFHPAASKPLVFAGDKMGNLGLFDGSQTAQGVKREDDEEEDDAEPAIATFKPHTRTISAMHFAPSQPEAVYTSSYDSSIRKIDFEKGVSVEVYAPSSTDIEEPISGVSIPRTDPNLLHFTTLNGLFGQHDLRTPATSAPAALLQLSEKKIGGFSLHPLQPHLLATASLDRTLKLWDLRRITGRGDARAPALVAEHESKLSVSHAAFNSAGQIATSSYDDTIKLHTLPSALPTTLPLPDFAPTTTIRHNNQTGRWVTILRPQWQEAPPAGGPHKFVIGNMNRFVDVYAGSGEQLAQLGGESLTAVPAVAVLHPSREWVAGGTASGKLALWM